MATTSTTISSLLMAAVVCCWSIVTTAEGTLNHWATNRQQLNRIFPARPFLHSSGNNDFPLNSDYDISYDGRHLEMPSTEMMSVNPESRASGRFSRPNNFLSSDDSSATGERTFQTFANLFASRQLCPACPGCPSCPSCPACPSPTCPVCQTCQTCPTVPVIPAQTISLAPAVGECFSTGAANILTTVSIAPCTRVSAAPKGTIDVTFSDPANLQTVTIGIVAVTPNTQIKLTCTAIPTGGASVAKTQVGAITANVAITANGFLQIIASGAGAPPTAIKLTCVWESS
uniref:Uncharacterized protein n=1 Tax=Daphnia galeata TaxID=27404 RepID=A0A8J2WJP8_9CRUS|nr:unnamed protein product [Daphnia galeata]